MPNEKQPSYDHLDSPTVGTYDPGLLTEESTAPKILNSSQNLASTSKLEQTEISLGSPLNLELPEP